MIDGTILFVTFNDQDNIRRCLDSVVGCFSRTYIFDSYSTDETLNIVH